MHWIWAAAPTITLDAVEALPEVNLKSQLATMFFALGGIVFCLLLIVWLYRRLVQRRIGVHNFGSTIKISDRKALSPKSTLYVVEAHNKSFLIVESTTGVVNLGEVPKPEMTVEPSVETLSFKDILKRKFQKIKL